MKRSITLLLALTVALTLAAVPVAAEPPIPADGHWTYVVDLDSIVQVPAGPNLFTFAEDEGTWSGTFNGISHERFVVLCLPKKDGRHLNFYRGVMSFDDGVVVEDDAGNALYTGSMVVRTNGLQVSDTCLPSVEFDWHGRWRIIGGSGELANGEPAGIQGRGTFEGPSFSLTYDGQIHFS